MTTPSEHENPDGFTIGIFLPKEAPQEAVDRVIDAVSKLVYGGLLDDRGQWDPFMVGRRGDVFQIDSGCECCPSPHLYFSTSCYHGDHKYCQRETGLLGNKTPAVCKFCRAPCLCSCHLTHVENTDKRSVDGTEGTCQHSGK